MKHRIVRKVKPSPTKLPVLNPEQVHREALERTLSKNVAVGVTHTDITKTYPVVPEFELVNRPQSWVKSIDNEYTDLIDLDPYFFQCPPRKDILHRMVLWQLAKRRQGTHKTKYRLEKPYTKKKMYRQKGTGRARHKDYGAPQFQIRGGHAHPKRPRDYSFKLNKKVRTLALRMALTAKYLQNKITIIEEIKIDEPKTKQVVKIAEKWGFNKQNPVMFIDGEKMNEDFVRAANNLQYVHILPVQGLNVYDILRIDNLVITREALELLPSKFMSKEEKQRRAFLKLQQEATVQSNTEVSAQSSQSVQ